MLADKVPVTAEVVLLAVDVVLSLVSMIRGCWLSIGYEYGYGFPGIYGRPRF